MTCSTTRPPGLSFLCGLYSKLLQFKCGYLGNYTRDYYRGYYGGYQEVRLWFMWSGVWGSRALG